MQIQSDKFKNMPDSGKFGVSLWIVSWVWLISTYYYLTRDADWSVKLTIAACLLGCFLFKAQNWARLISALANVMGIFLSGYFFLAGFILIATVNVILFGGAIYFLMVPATSQYFKAQSKYGNRQDGENR